MSEGEKEAIAHLTWLLDSGILASEDEPHVETVLNLIQTQKAIINAMAVKLYEYANLGFLKICPAEQENGNYNMDLCKMSLAERNCIICIEEYFENLVKDK